MNSKQRGSNNITHRELSTLKPHWMFKEKLSDNRDVSGETFNFV